MLTSIVLQLQATSSGRIHGSSGRAVHGFWMNQWQNILPAIGDMLHQPNVLKPFTLSPLMDLPYPQKGTTFIPEGHQSWLRISTLNEAVSQPLLETWLPRLPAQIELADIQWHVKKIALMPQEHPWARQTTYGALRDTASRKKWSLALVTPTTFHMGKDAYLPFPLPGALFNSWLRRWEAFSPVPFANIDRTHIQQQLFVSSYKLKTVPVRQGQRVTIGCVGEMQLRAGKLSPSLLATISTLAAYAFYCGGGRYTTQGMGMIRPINPISI